MNTIKNEIINEIIINKSQFITHLAPCDTVEKAKRYEQKIRDTYPDATHHICCYTIGKTGEAGHYDDDGEPSGTAGLPALDVFRKNHITNFVCIITRYFGGIKLGAGGLIRAYSKSAAAALKLNEIVPIINYNRYQVVFHYSYINEIDRILDGCIIKTKIFSDKVTYVIDLDENCADYLLQEIKALTNNMAIINQINLNE